MGTRRSGRDAHERRRDAARKAHDAVVGECLREVERMRLALRLRTSAMRVELWLTALAFAFGVAAGVLLARSV